MNYFRLILKRFFGSTEQLRPKASKVSLKSDLIPGNEKIFVMPLNVKAEQDPLALPAVFETESNPEEIDAISIATENPRFVKNNNESEMSSTEILTRRSLRERLPAAVDLVDFDDGGSEDNVKHHSDCLQFA